MSRFSYVSLGLLFAGCTGKPTASLPTEASGTALAEEQFARFSERHAFVTKFSALPHSGSTRHEPWADSNWPSYLGGIAWRWNDPAATPFPERPEVSRAEVEAMTLDERKTLSPAEKYDAFMGWQGEGGTDWLLRLEYSPEEPWAGICGGWSSAALIYPEPNPVTLQGPSGISIPFGSSDVKALLSLYMESGYLAGEMGVEQGFELPDFEASLEVQERLVARVGTDCSPGDDTSTCEDVSPAMFHLALANLLGLQHDGFVMDVKSESRQYFQPVSAFQTKVSEISRAQGTTLYSVETQVTTAVDLLENRPAEQMDYSNPDHFAFTLPSFLPRIASAQNRMETRTYVYELSVNSQDEIVGGRWISALRPDSFFKHRPPESFKGHLRGLKEIFVP